MVGANASSLCKINAAPYEAVATVKPTSKTRPYEHIMPSNDAESPKSHANANKKVVCTVRTHKSLKTRPNNIAVLVIGVTRKRSF